MLYVIYCVAHQRNAYLWLVNWMHLVRWQCIVYSTELLFTLTFSVNMYHSAIWLAFYVHTQLNLQHAIQNKKCTNKTSHYNQIVKVSNYSKLFTTNNLRIIPRLADVYRLKLWWYRKCPSLNSVTNRYCFTNYTQEF